MRSGGRWIGDSDVFHGEGAYWDPAAGALRYVDMLSGDILTHNGHDERTSISDVVALVRPRESGGYVVATERGFALLDDGLVITTEIPVFDDPAVRMNEGGVDSAGRLYCGSLAYDYHQGGGQLYRLDADLSVHLVLDRVTIPNGLVWTRGDTIALHADTSDDAIYAYDFDLASGTFGERHVFIDFSATPGSPDGVALDAEGGLWVAMWGGAAVRRYNSAGVLTDVVPLPVSNVTSCAIGGPGGTTLYVTTSRQGLGDRVEPHAGRVFEIEIGVAAAPGHSFAG